MRTFSPERCSFLHVSPLKIWFLTYILYLSSPSPHTASFSAHVRSARSVSARSKVERRKKKAAALHQGSARTPFKLCQIRRSRPRQARVKAQQPLPEMGPLPLKNNAMNVFTERALPINPAEDAGGSVF